MTFATNQKQNNLTMGGYLCWLHFITTEQTALLDELMPMATNLSVIAKGFRLNIDIICITTILPLQLR